MFHKNVERLGKWRKRVWAWERSPRGEMAQKATSFPAAKGSEMAPETVRWDWICLMWRIVRHGWSKRERTLWVDFKYLEAKATTIP